MSKTANLEIRMGWQGLAERFDEVGQGSRGGAVMMENVELIRTVTFRVLQIA